jgi:hypothetical protein
MVDCSFGCVHDEDERLAKKRKKNWVQICGEIAHYKCLTIFSKLKLRPIQLTCPILLPDEKAKTYTLLGNNCSWE